MGINSLNDIKFIGVGVKGIDIVNKLSHDNKKYIKLCAIDIKDTNIDEKVSERLIIKNLYNKDKDLYKVDFFQITDIINRNKEIIYKIIEKEKIVFITCDICDLTSVHILIELGKMAKKSNILVIPIIINTQDNQNINYKFFMKKVNNMIGPTINISNNKVFGNIKYLNDKIDDYYIIHSIIDLFIDNLMSTCSLNVDYEDMKWIFSGEQDVEMSIIKINEKSSEDDMKIKLVKHRICKGSYEHPEKIMINATANEDYMGYDEAIKLLQRVALVLQEGTEEACQITFSLKFIKKKSKSLEVLTVQA
ncbi:hypothetical protein [Romboutsia sp. Marseille-P6047]|uniref:hypothetical protein n=1 Tax=Romboutsia sp. Marseille-P6047 TaxID=2161817 RepID=UPI000F06B114|nr:hypothetical protein [Romboutsia sp. Marseille-P6047]